MGGSSGVKVGGPAGEGGEGGELEAVPSTMHRLSNAEYEATVLDVLGSSATPPLADDEYFDGYDNNAEVLSVGPSTFERYFDAAQTVADDVFASPQQKAKIVTCQAQDDTACVRSIVSDVGLRLFRRPLLDAELDVYQKLYFTSRAQNALHEDSLKRVLVALLSSVEFLYRIEFAPAANGPQPVGAYDLASRLSYLLWSSAPDDALLAAAAADQLSDDSELSEQVTRLWQDPRSRRFALNFGGQWLRTRSVAAHAADPMLFAEWTQPAAQAAADEAVSFFEQLVQDERPAVDLVTGYSHRIGPELASLYGLAAPISGESLLLPEGERSGFLGSVAFLAQTSTPERTDPIVRGNAILATLLCMQVPTEPPDLTWGFQLPDPPPPTVRKILETFDLDPKCVPCHSLMDPLGLALEHYDAIGRYRDAYTNGAAVDSNVRLAPWPNHPDGANASGLADIVERVKTDPAFAPCVAQNLYTYGMGRMTGGPDDRNAKTLARLWQRGPVTLKRLVKKLALGRSFRYRDDQNDRAP